MNAIDSVPIGEIENQMEPKCRQFSSQPTLNMAISVDSDHRTRIDVVNDIRSYGNQPKLKLNQLMPQILQLESKRSQTNAFNEKFTMRGVRDGKVLMPKNCLKKKQEVTEASTPYQHHFYKEIIGLKSAKTASNGKNIEGQHQEHQESVIDNKLSHLQLKEIHRTTSVKGFKKYGNCENQHQKMLVKNKTQSNLSTVCMRPVTAAAKKNWKQQTNINYCDENKPYFSQMQRPTTATTSKQRSSIKEATQSLYQKQQLTNLIKLKIKECPLKIQSSNKGIDYIGKNKQNLSTYSKKTRSIYLTNANLQQITSLNQNCENIQIKSNIDKRNISGKVKRNTIGNVYQPSQVKKEFEFDRLKHEKQMKKVEHYLIQSIPDKFQKVDQQLQKIQKKNKRQQNHQQLLSKDLDNNFEDNHQQITQRSAQTCFESYLQNCEMIQNDIASAIKPAQKINNGKTTLNIWECHRIVEIYETIKSETNKKKKTESICQIKQIVKHLKYFMLKSQQQVNGLFHTPFEIIVVEEGNILIDPNQRGQHIYIILNGSVVAQSLISSTNPQMCPTSIANLQAQTSLYDGEIFGQICNPSQHLYKAKYTTLEQCLMMKVKFHDYASVILPNNESEQKLSILKLAFKSEINSAIITEEELQMISKHLEKQRYQAKSLVFREGESFNFLVFVAKGTLQAINQFILSQKKHKPKNMKDIDQQKQNQKQLQAQSNSQKPKSYSNCGIDKILISEMRKQNLINFQIVQQNQQKIYYYFMKEQTHFVKGDTLNWQPIISTFSAQKYNNFMKESIHTAFNQSNQLYNKATNYSLMSNCDDTQIYTLSMSAFECLTNEIKQKLIAKGKLHLKNIVKISSERDIKKWEVYKSKLCENIVREKKERRSRMGQ